MNKLFPPFFQLFFLSSFSTILSHLFTNISPFHSFSVLSQCLPFFTFLSFLPSFPFTNSVVLFPVIPSYSSISSRRNNCREMDNFILFSFFKSSLSSPTFSSVTTRNPNYPLRSFSYVIPYVILRYHYVIPYVIPYVNFPKLLCFIIVRPSHIVRPSQIFFLSYPYFPSDSHLTATFPFLRISQSEAMIWQPQNGMISISYAAKYIVKPFSPPFPIILSF